MIVWKPLKNKLLDLRWVKKINESELSILLKNGTTIALKGAEDGGSRLRGTSLDFVCVDEAATCKLDELWGEILRPALADRQGGALFIGTPAGKSNAFFDLYTFAKDEANTDWRAWQYTTEQGGFVSKQELEAARQDMTEKQFNQEFRATFESYENQVAWEFNRDIHLHARLDFDTSIVHVGLDFNVSPMTATVAVQEGNTLYTIDELKVYSSNTQEVADELRSRYPRSKIFAYPDPSGSARKTAAGGVTDHIILQNAGFVVKAPRKHDPVRDRINALNARLRSATGEINLYISKDNKYTIESLEKHTFKPGTGIPDKDTGFDHMFDALSYMVAYLYPVRKTPTQPQTPGRWGHKIV